MQRPIALQASPRAATKFHNLPSQQRSQQLSPQIRVTRGASYRTNRRKIETHPTIKVEEAKPHVSNERQHQNVHIYCLGRLQNLLSKQKGFWLVSSKNTMRKGQEG